MDFPDLDCSRFQSDFSYLLWNSYTKLVSNWKESYILHIVVSNHKKDYFCSSCRIQSEEPFKDLSLPNK